MSLDIFVLKNLRLVDYGKSKPLSRSLKSLKTAKCDATSSPVWFVGRILKTILRLQDMYTFEAIKTLSQDPVNPLLQSQPSPCRPVSPDPLHGEYLTVSHQDQAAIKYSNQCSGTVLISLKDRRVAWQRMASGWLRWMDERDGMNWSQIYVFFA
ncbi:hypothetical protein DFH09DRAFT_1284910 [Mycena vulgaris]|nr:hypothetical protein DFH09DRAFT_1284910 [Mycena vulgaris]